MNRLERLHRMGNYTLFEFLPEAILECCGPIEWPVPQTFADIEKTMLVFMLFVVKVFLVSRPATTDAKDVQEPLGFRLMSVRIIGISFGDGAPREGIFPQEIRSIYQPRGSEAEIEWRWGGGRTGEPVQETLQTTDLVWEGFSLFERGSVYPIIKESLGSH